MGATSLMSQPQKAMPWPTPEASDRTEASNGRGRQSNNWALNSLEFHLEARTLENLGPQLAGDVEARSWL